jgi:3-phosphoshikimate 1-carboxyvinyltransferase
MIVSVQPSQLSGTVHAPASKSAMQRACAAALTRKGETIIHNPGNSNDDRAAIDVIRQLGALVSAQEGGLLKISSRGINPISNQLNCGESGLGIRMFTPLAALSSAEIIISGHGSLVDRPMGFFDAVLPLLGIKIESNNGKLPLKIQGPLQPKNIEVDGSLSSQFLTGLLMAYAAADARDVTITVKDLKSKPYIDLTLQVMRDFGFKVPQHSNYTSFYFDSQPTNHQPSTINYAIEGDWSGGAFLLVAAAISGSVRVEGLFNASKQADKKIVDALLDAGAEITSGDDFVQVKKKQLQPFELDATDCPDLFPPLVALAANCKGVTRIRGLKRLKHKESDRGITLQEEFGKLNTRIDLNDDEMLVHGNKQVQVKDHVLDSHHDHRIAMACAVACLDADAEVDIRNADAVKKSYPDFWDHLKQLNAVLSLKPFTTDNTFRL